MHKQLPSLNGLRALSILCVLIAHIQIINLRLPNGPGGQVGVTIFFVISGFLITLLLLKEEAATGTVSLRNFFVRRSLRIFPVFYVLLLVYLVLQAAGVVHIGVSSWLSSATYTKYFFATGQNDWETGHIWSLSVEEHFYLVWPLVFVYAKKFRTAFAVAVVIAVPAVRLFTATSVMHLATRADALMWGCLFALYYENVVSWVKRQPVIARFIPFGLLAFCLVAKAVLHIPDSQVALAFFGSFGMVTNLCIGAIIIISITFQNNLYFAFLNCRPLNFLGKLSYSIYLWQQLFFADSISPLSRLPYNLLCIAAVSVASYYLVEKPFLKLKDRFSRKVVPVVVMPKQRKPVLEG